MEHKMAQETGSMKSAFLGLMSQEIRTVLSSVTGIHNLLLETSLTSEQQGYVDSAQNASEMLLTLVNDLVDFSLIETGALKLDAITFDLRTTVEEAMEAVAYRALEKGSEVHTLIHASVPEMVSGDPARIRQIIYNLAGNALDFSESGEVVLSVKTVEEADDRVVVRFDVTEFGIGLNTEQIQQLFQPFSQVDTVTSWKYGKMGLGLALSKRLAQLMGGQIGLSSVAGKGSTFWFSVELKKSPAGVPAVTVPVQSIEGMNILIADPSPSGRRIMVHYLESMGCKCREFEHSEDILMDLAYSDHQPVRYDAMIIAMQQVGEAGHQLAARIRKDELVKSIPLVLVTATGKRGDAQKLKEVGVAAYLTRPLKQHELIECMRMIQRENELAAARAADGTPPVVLQQPLITRHTIAEEHSGKKFRILVAEDNAANRKTVKKYLDKAGYGCDFAENGVDAVASFGKKEYDLVFMDCSMPVMNGFDAVSALRTEELNRSAGSHVPICGMVAGVLKNEKARCIAAGMDDCIVKPFTRKDFIAMVEMWEKKA